MLEELYTGDSSAMAEAVAKDEPLPAKRHIVVIEQVSVDPLLRLSDVLKIIPIGKTSWFKGIRNGDYPKPIKLSGGLRAWRLSDIRRLAEEGVL